VVVKSAKEVDGLKIVNLDWLLESIENGKRGDEEGFLVGDESTAAGPSAAVAPAAVKATAAAPIATKAEPEELPKKRTRGKAADLPPAAKVAIDEESEEETKPAAKKAKAMPVGKGKGKGKAKEEPEEDEGEEGKQEIEEVKKMKTIVKKGKAPVDELCPIAGISLFSKDINMRRILISSRESPCLRRPRLLLGLRCNPKPSGHQQ